MKLSSEFTQDIRVCLKFLDIKLAYTLERHEAHLFLVYITSLHYLLWMWTVHYNEPLYKFRVTRDNTPAEQSNGPKAAVVLALYVS